MYEGLLPVVIATTLVLDSIKAKSLPQNGGCPVGFNFRENHLNTCCKTRKCPENTYYVLCNGTADNPGYDTCHSCPPDRPISESINTAEAAKYSVVDPCMKPDCKCPRPGAIPPLDNSCFKDGIKQCQCDRAKGYYGTDYLKCQKANDKVKQLVKQPGYELSNSGEAIKCPPGTFKPTADSALCRNHSRCPEDFVEKYSGNSTNDVRCKQASETNMTSIEEHDRENKKNSNINVLEGAIIVLGCVFTGCIVVLVICIYRHRSQKHTGIIAQVGDLNRDVVELEEMRPLVHVHPEVHNDNREGILEHDLYVAIGENNLDQSIGGFNRHELEDPNIRPSDQNSSINDQGPFVQSSELDLPQKDAQIKIIIRGNNNTVIVTECCENPAVCPNCSARNKKKRSFTASFTNESLKSKRRGSKEQLSTLFNICSTYPSNKNLAVPCPSRFGASGSNHHDAVESGSIILGQLMPTEYPIVYIPQHYVPSPIIHDFDSFGLSSLASENISDIYFPQNIAETREDCENIGESSLSSMTYQKNVYETIRNIANELPDPIPSPEMVDSFNLSSLKSSSEQVDLQVPDVNQTILFEDLPRENDLVEDGLRSNVSSDFDETRLKRV